MKHNLTLALALLCLASNSFATKLNSFQEAVAAANEGKMLTFLVHFDKCTVVGNAKALPENWPNLAVFKPTGMIIRDDQYIRSRGMTYSHHIDAFPNLGPTNQAYSYSFTANNQLQIMNSFLDPVTYAEKMPSLKLVCELGKSFDVVV